MCWILRQKISILKMWIVPYVRRWFFCDLSLSLSFFRWVAKAYQVEQCYILRLSAQRSRDGNTEGKYSYECIWTYFWLLGFLSVTQLPCLSADLHHHDNIRLKSSTLCRQVMSHVSMWWWAEWTKSGGQNKEKKYTRIKKKKNRKEMIKCVSETQHQFKDQSGKKPVKKKKKVFVFCM